MTKYKAKGTLLAVGEIREFGSGFTSRKFVVDTTENPNYKSPVEFTLKKERCGDIEGYKPGEAVEVEFSIDGREWNGPNGTKYFIDLMVWHLGRVGVVMAPGSATGQAPANGGASMQQAVETWKKHHGEDKAGFGEYCKKLFPGKKSSAYTSADWGAVVAQLEEDAKTKGGEAKQGVDFDDLPF